MKTLYSIILFFFFTSFTFSQVITFECNNEVITVSFDEIANNPNAYLDWNGDGVINDEDYIIYLNQVYGCDELTNGCISDIDEDGICEDDCEEIVTIIEDCECSFFNPNTYTVSYTIVDEASCTLIETCYCECINDVNNNGICDEEEDNNWGDVFTFECNGELITIELTLLNDTIDYESYIDSILSDYDCEEWGGEDENNWTDIDWIVSDWEDFNWENFWNDLDLDNLVDWDNIPWDEIIDLNIFTEDFIDYIIYINSGGQPFNWNEFIDYYSNSVNNIENINYNKLVMTHSINLMGQDISRYHKLIFHIYDDGHVVKQFIIK